MVHGRGCNPHRSLWRHWWRHNSETITDKRKTETTSAHEILWAIKWWKPHRSMRNDVIYDVIIWVQDGNWKKMAWENFSIGAFYYITKNQDNPIKTVKWDSFLSTKTPKNTSFLGSPSPQGLHSPYILGDTTRPRHITCVLVWSKSDQRRLRKTLHKQTNRQTDRQTLRK